MKRWLFLSLLATQAFAQDPMATQQWGLKNVGQKLYRATGDNTRDEIVGIPGADIRLPEASVLAQLAQAKEVVVAVLDSGIDMGHPEFAGRLYAGRDFLDNAEMKDDMGHGTHTAGIIAANTDGRGTQGVTPANVKLLPLRVFSKDTTSYVYKGKVITDIIADAIGYAIEARASVIHMSLGWTQLTTTPRIQRALDTAAQMGVVMVAASGNNGKDAPMWPCSHPAVICVGAMDNQGKLTSFSNWGGKVDLVAPGEWIVSTHPRNIESRSLRIQGYEAKNGSSQAAPFVSAAAALLKLQNPNYTAKDIKARLYASATALPADADGHYVRYGALSIKDALAINPPPFASVLVKSLVTVDVDQQGNYDFVLPIEVLGNSTSVPSVTVEGLDAAVETTATQVRLRGRLPDLAADYQVPVVFHTALDGQTTHSKVGLDFALAIKNTDLHVTRVPPVQAKNVMAINGLRRRHIIGHVSVEDRPSSDFHGFAYAKEGDNLRGQFMRATMDQDEAVVSPFLLADHSQIMSVFEKDVNFDGLNDLVVYGMNAKRDTLVLTFLTLDARPLFGANSRWNMPITTFEGLPLKNGETADFSWLKVRTIVGEIAVPYYQKQWQMPDLDNSQRLLAHVVSSSVDSHLYYWEPFVDGAVTKARPRVVDSVAFEQRLETLVTKAPWETINVERLLPQSQSERSAGVVRHVVSVGEGFFRRFSILRVASPGSYSLEKDLDGDVFKTGNNAVAARKTSDFTLASESFQLALMDRTTARLAPVIEGGAVPAWTFRTSGWNNPLFEVNSAFVGDGQRTVFFEARYHVYVLKQSGDDEPKLHRLPINRESSLMDMNFSETLQALVVDDRGVHTPAVMVDSTQIFGDRLYTMVSSADAFRRPLEFSVKVPANCVPLKARVVGTERVGAYVMACQGSAGELDLAFYPLKTL